MRKPSSRNQYLVALCVSILCLGAGASISWTSPYLSLLKSVDSPLNHPITSSQASWVGSLLATGALAGSFLYGWLSEKIGRFPSLILAAFPQILWWLIVIFSSTAKWLYLGRFMAGLSTGGCFTLVPLYIAEISQDDVRGSLGSFFCLSLNAGMLSMYIAGKVLSYTLTPKVMLLAPVGFLICFAFCTETPVYLLRHGKTKKATKALEFLRTRKSNEDACGDVTVELQKMIRKVNNDAFNKRNSTLSELNSPAECKGIWIGVVLIAVNQLSGLFTFLNYTADVFTDAGSSLDPHTSATVAGAVMLVGSLLSMVVLDKFPRKFLYLWTTAGYIAGLIAMGAYSYFKTVGDTSNFKYTPVLSLSWIIFVACVGRLPLTFILMAEVMPQSIRSLGVSICITVNWILCFLMLKFFSTLVEMFEFHTCMFIFTGSAIFGTIFVSLYVPETKNRSFEEIENALSVRNVKYSPTAQVDEIKSKAIAFE